MKFNDTLDSPVAGLAYRTVLAAGPFSVDPSQRPLFFGKLPLRLFHRLDTSKVAFLTQIRRRRKGPPSDEDGALCLVRELNRSDVALVGR